MKKLNLVVLVLVMFFSVKAFAQDMMPPAPVNSPIMESMMGTWVSEPYDMMGAKMTDIATHSMILNGQFMEVDVKSTADGGFVWEGKGIMAPNNDGTITGWMYDIFGVNGISSYTGTSENNKVYLTGTSSMGKEIRNITVDGNVMIHNVIYKWKDKDGKDMPEMTLEITYNKKN